MPPNATASHVLLHALLAVCAALALLGPGATAAGDFTHYESSHVHPLALAPGGDELYAVNTPEARLAIFAVNSTGDLAFLGDVPVGLEPVSLAVRAGTSEVWVVNHLSDSVSVVDVAARRLVATLAVGDEPTDLVFASGRAFVSLAGKEDRVAVIDAETRELVTRLDVFGDDPRALAATPDGARVVLTVLESGNRTVNVHPSLVTRGPGVPPPDPPRDPALPRRAAPREGLIVKLDPASGMWLDETGGAWSDLIDFNLPDLDLFWIDAAAAAPQIVATTSGVGTTLFNVAIHPASGEAWVSSTDARNLVRFEPNLRGHLVETRISRVDADSGAVTPIDLNPHIDFSVSPGPPEERALSLAQPGQGVFDAAGERFYLTAFGSAKVAVLDGESGAVLQRIPVRGGPSGVALLEGARRLYVMSRFEQVISTVDLDAGAEIASIGVAGPARFDPSPPEVREGRRFLYDAELSSGHGDLSCASCHVFANFDGLVWDLGDPQGAFLRYDQADWVEFAPVVSSRLGFDPMKGPISTQTLRGLRGQEPFHWRGDRRDFQAFNGAFVSLLGRAEPLSAGEIDAFSEFIMTVELPPNPNRELDDSPAEQLELPHLNPSAGNAARGQILFETVPSANNDFLCTDCHALPSGTLNTLTLGAGAQDTKIAHLRNVYEKAAFDPLRLGQHENGSLINNLGAFDQKSGLGVLHEGALGLLEFLSFAFVLQPEDLADMTAFLHSFPTGSFPCVGHQLTLDGPGAQTPAALATLATLLSEAEVGHCDLVAKGVMGGTDVGFFYDPALREFVSDSERQPIAIADFGAGDILTYTGVPPGNGRRLGIDRDRDGCLDGDEVLQGTAAANPGVLRDDADDDGIADEFDLCPGWKQVDRAQTDSDGNGRPDECECGDVSGDGRVNVLDLLMVARFLGGSPLRGFSAKLCNVTGAAGQGPEHCTEADFIVLRGRVGRRRGGAAAIEPVCHSTEPLPDPPPRVCADL